MRYGRHLAFWIITFLVLFVLIWLLHEILLPFVAGMALAYVQAPLADRLERFGINRTVAALLIVAVVVLVLLALVLFVVPLLVAQGLGLLSNIPGYVDRIRALIAQSELPWLNEIAGGDTKKTLTELVRGAAGWLATFAASLWAGGKALASFASVLIVMPVVTFYLITDWHRMLAILDGWVPPRHRETVRGLTREIDQAVSGFLRGQLGVCFFLGLYYAIALMLVGLNFGLLIGLAAGLLTFVPYIGSLTGLLVATSVAIAQFWPDWKWIVTVVAIFLVGQFVEGNIISPKFVGERVGLHPVWVIFAMFAFGYLFGFVGLIVAVPLAAAIAVLVRFGLRQYLGSPIYSGEKPIA
jgi:predicted PurR-regulated permease PerM